ncbi:hypothetical protein BACI9J_60288 [Bacillus altitudinis]|nr:hypothetical protein BACI9J_60288 [Bacillus altitudinis]
MLLHCHVYSSLNVRLFTTICIAKDKVLGTMPILRTTKRTSFQLNKTQCYTSGTSAFLREYTQDIIGLFTCAYIYTYNDHSKVKEMLAYSNRFNAFQRRDTGGHDMIKLIITDLDGTFLNNEGSFDQALFQKTKALMDEKMSLLLLVLGSSVNEWRHCLVIKQRIFGF